MAQLQEILDRAWGLQQAGNFPGAELIYRQVIGQLPSNPAPHVYLGIALFDQRRFAESADSYRTALKLQNTFPIAWNNLGNSLRMLGEVEEADRCFAKAIAQKPDYLSPLKNRGTLWIWSGDVKRGLTWYDQASQLAPNDPELHRNLGLIHLLQERYAEGWPEYRWRWNFAGYVRPPYPFPIWQGEAVAGKTILLYPEQGLGDALQFVRVAALLKSAGARTLVACANRLIPLFSSVPGIDALLPEGMAMVERVDYHASMIDVVDHWYGSTGQLATTAPGLDLAGGYITPSESLVDYWRRNLFGNAAGDAKNKLRVGLCWQGNPQHHADIYRSVMFAEFEPVVSLPHASFISLQHGFGSEQLAASSFGKLVQTLPSNIDQSGGAFLDTAAIMHTLDLVITTDTSTAHLAGALGVPVWVILGKVPDWRWLEQGATTPWYPTMKLYRQTQIGDWSSVIQQIASELGQRGMAD